MTALELMAGGSAAAAVALLLRPTSGLPSAADRSGPRGRVAVKVPPLPMIAAVSASLAVLLLVPGPAGPLGALLAALGVHRWVRRLEPASARRRRAELERALPQVVDHMATCLAAGTSPAAGIVAVSQVTSGAIAEELALFVARLRLGADPASVWRDMATHPQLGPLGRALLRASDSGAPVGDSLVRLATEQRAARRAYAEQLARSVEVKASLPLGLCLLPAFVLVGIVPVVAGSFSLTFLG